MRQFVMKYGKWVGIAVAVITFGLLAIPHFLRLGNAYYSGYEMIFRAKLMIDHNGDIFNYLASNGNYSVCVIGIIALVFTLLSGLSFLFDKNSSALDIIGGIMLLISSVIFLAMQGWAVICYKDPEFATNGILEIAYIIGALQLVAGALMTYKGFALLKEEKNNPKTVGYSYLKKNSK